MTVDRRPALRVVAGNKGENGPFAPLVRVTRNAMGTKEFNQFRGTFSTHFVFCIP